MQRVRTFLRAGANELWKLFSFPEYNLLQATAEGKGNYKAMFIAFPLKMLLFTPEVCLY